MGIISVGLARICFLKSCFIHSPAAVFSVVIKSTLGLERTGVQSMCRSGASFGSQHRVQWLSERRP